MGAIYGLSYRFWPGSLRDGLWRQMKRLPIGYPALDVVEAAFAAQLVEGPDILKGMRERTMDYFWHDGTILAGSRVLVPAVATCVLIGIDICSTLALVCTKVVLDYLTAMKPMQALSI